MAAENPATLAVLLHGKRIGVIGQLPGDRHLFTFDEDYMADETRATLSLSFQNKMGGLINDDRVTHLRLPTFFSNLLPEGPLRDYLAINAGVKTGREFLLLSLLGTDLPGGITVVPLEQEWGPFVESENALEKPKGIRLLKFSLAGVQLKFSAVLSGAGHLTIPANGANGFWIVKLPSPNFPAIAENEFVIMETARKIGIDVPETMLIPVSEIEGLPKEFEALSGNALAVKRFDRTADGMRIHMEDFAQIFGIYPENKYEQRSYANIAQVLASQTSITDVEEFIRRLTFSILTGNGDMHLKNWTVIYPDKRTPKLSPAYDLISTIPYIPDDNLALTFGKYRSLTGIARRQIEFVAERAGMPDDALWKVVHETAENTMDIWQNDSMNEILPSSIRDIISRQIAKVASTIL